VRTRGIRVHHKQGFALMECLFSILIFSVGILTLVLLQTKAIYQSREAKYRMDASMLANQLIGEMWIADRGSAALDTRFGSTAAGSGYSAWQSTVAATLPGVATSPPTVTVATSGSMAGSTVTIQIFWKAPTEQSSAPAHRYVVTTQIL